MAENNFTTVDKTLSRFAPAFSGSITDSAEFYAQIISNLFEQGTAKENLYSENYLEKLYERDSKNRTFWHLIISRQKYLNSKSLLRKAFCYFKSNISRFKRYLRAKSPISFIMDGDRNKIYFLLNSLFYPLRNLNFQY